MSQQDLRLELQVDVNLRGVEGHAHSAQDDVKCSLVQKRGEKNPTSLTFEIQQLSVRTNMWN